MNMGDNSDENQEEEGPTPPKRRKLFSVREFRAKIQTAERNAELGKFVSVCSKKQKDDAISLYLRKGGSCMEILNLLSHEDVSYVVLRSFNSILVHIISHNPSLHTQAYDACKFFLNYQLSTVDKMFLQTTANKEKIAILELLSVMVTFSTSLAKYVLLNVTFNVTKLESISKHAQTGKSVVRNAYIDFALAFLVESHPVIISFLLERKLLEFVLRGIRFDQADTVCLILGTLKKFILENASVKKTTKMKLFNTTAIKDLINLYNWRGPEGITAKTNTPIQLNPTLKAKVNEAVHDFLLTLCTTKFGVIFHDQLVGLDKRNCNPLMCTVLECLERPWEHTYAAELVAKTCAACPDLSKTIWGKLQPHLVPATTHRWIKAVAYAKKLLKELDPKCIDYCARDLSPFQLTQITQMLVAPLPILKSLQDQNAPAPHELKLHTLTLIHEFLKSIKLYTESAKNWQSAGNYKIFMNLVTEHLSKNFPTVSKLFENWQKETAAFSSLRLLETIFHIIELYKLLFPKLLDDLDQIDAESFLTSVRKLEKSLNSTEIQVRAISIFLKSDPTLFFRNSNVFARICGQCFGFYYETKSEFAGNVLRDVLLNDILFEGCSTEIPIWINSIFDCQLDSKTLKQLGRVFSQISENHFEFLEKLSDYDRTQRTVMSFSDIINSLRDDSFHLNIPVKHTRLSSVIIGFFDNMRPEFVDYFNCVLINLLHTQTNPDLITKIVLEPKNKPWVLKGVRKYFRTWKTQPTTQIPEISPEINQEIINALIDNKFDDFLLNFDDRIGIYPGHELNLSNYVISVFMRMLELQQLDQTHLVTFVNIIKQLLSKTNEKSQLYAKIFTHPTLLSNFMVNPLATRFIVDFVKQMNELGHKDLFDVHLNPFRAKLTQNFKVLTEETGQSDMLELIQVIGLSYAQNVEILNLYQIIHVELLINNNILYNLLVYTLNFLNQTDKTMKPIDTDLLNKLFEIFQFLNEKQMQTGSLAKELEEQLRHYPHNIIFVKDETFESILKRNELCKENVKLAGLLLENNCRFLQIVFTNIDLICEKRGLVLPLLDKSIVYGIPDELFGKIYEKIGESVVKVVEKPHKCLKLLENYKSMELIIDKFFAAEYCVNLMKKVGNFEVFDQFHVALLIKVFLKGFSHSANVDKEDNTCNAILTLCALVNGAFRKKDIEMSERISQRLFQFLKQIQQQKPNISYRGVIKHNHFNTFLSFALKYGMSSHSNFLKVVTLIVKLFDFTETAAEYLMEMLISHSNFLDILLNEFDESGCKCGVLELLLILSKKWPNLKRKNHVAILFGSFQATTSDADLITLELLQIYEKDTSTNFHEFKPFLWGRAAISHYSLKDNAQKPLWRQPQPSDVLGLLDGERIMHTLCNYPLKLGLKMSQGNYDQDSYNLSFLLPLFATLLASESPAPVHSFIRDGPLSLTVIGFSSEDKEIRKAACLVLARLCHHLEGPRGGKDRFLWLRFSEFLCRGVAVMNDMKISNVVAIFCARMARILTQPLHNLYTPLSQYLMARPAPDFNCVPELQVFLHSPDVNYQEHRQFILEILRDGIRTDNDFQLAAHSMAFKFIMELFDTNSVADLEVKLLILEVIERALRLDNGKKVLCNHNGLISWLYEISGKIRPENNSLIVSLVAILEHVVTLTLIDHEIIAAICRDVIERKLTQIMKVDTFNQFLSVLQSLYQLIDVKLSENNLRKLIKISDDHYCYYLLNYYRNRKDLSQSDIPIRFITVKWIILNV